MADAPGSRRTVSKAALACLLLQHSSSAWGEQSLEFAAYLFLITLYPTSFLPASLLGLGITVSAISATTWIGHRVDTEPRCSFVRRLIVVQKICQSLCYAIFLFLFRDPSPSSSDTNNSAIPWPLILLLTISASGGRISTTGIDLAVCRDWVLVISSDAASARVSSSTTPGEPNHLLTFLTTSLRRITLICKLLSPLLISLLTTTVGYQAASAILLGTAGMTLVSEIVWIGVVWRKFKVLEEQEVYRRPARGVTVPLERGHEPSSSTPRGEDSTSLEHLYCPLNEHGNIDITETSIHPSQQLGTHGRIVRSVHEALGQWNEFRKMPVFLSSISISCLYLTTLSFESILISYLKSEANLSDLFIAVMRGVSVTTGLLGTAVMPVLERKLGLVRAGAWSIWCEIASLLPVVLCLYIGPGPSASSSLASITNTLIFFLTLSLSRLWLYCFDLVQLQSLLVALEHHPRRSEFAAMQVTMENGFDLVKYLVVLVFNKPEQFKWTAVISLVAVFVAGITYSTYLYQVRGHVFHFGKKHADAYQDVSEQVEMRLMASDNEQSR